MLKPVAISVSLAFAVSGCASTQADPFTLDQPMVQANDPFRSILANPNQRTTGGSLRNAQWLEETGAFSVRTKHDKSGDN